MTTRRPPRQGQKPSLPAALFAEVPSDYKVSGLAFQLPRRYARSADGDWYRVVGARLKPLMADDVDEEVLARGREYVAQILTRVM